MRLYTYKTFLYVREKKCAREEMEVSVLFFIFSFAAAAAAAIYSSMINVRFLYGNKISIHTYYIWINIRKIFHKFLITYLTDSNK